MTARPAQTASTSALLHRQAINHFRAGRMAEGIALLRKALEINPGSGEMHAHLAIALYQTGDAQAAARHFEKAARLAPKSAEVQTDCGVFLLESHKPQEAERLFRKALTVNPHYAEALINLGRSLVRQGRPDEAEAPYAAALRQRPQWVDALYNLGSLYLRTEMPSRNARGRQLLEQALSLDPKHALAWDGLIRSYERNNDYEMEEKTLARAENFIPDSQEFMVLKIIRLAREGKKDEIRPILQKLSRLVKDPAITNPSVLHEIGKAYDDIGEPDQAMQWFQLSSAVQKKSHDERKINSDAFSQRIGGYRRALALAKQWLPAPPLPPDRPCPVFLVGFPRSGTTLLDQIFASHTGIEVAEEKPALETTETKIAEGKNASPWDCLHTMTGAEIETARGAYFSFLKKAGFGLKPGAVFIDKMPLNMVHTPLIMRLFPDARFIMALRHPCDCVLSNYMQRFNPNAAMAHMVELDDAARFYDACFSAWEEAVDALNLKFHTVKYENVVEDMRAEIVRALEFLGLDWQDSVAAFDETAKTRQISTPSRRQVTQKLYTKAKGRWHRYRDYMGDVPEMLRPWAGKFGYEID